MALLGIILVSKVTDVSLQWIFSHVDARGNVEAACLTLDVLT